MSRTRFELATVVVAWLITTLPYPSSADYEKVCTQDRAFRPSRFLCGRQLSSVLSSLCKDGYYHDKRTGNRDVGGRSLSEAPVPEEHPVFLPKTRALAYLHQKRTILEGRWDGHHYQSQGIVCECCYHQCSFKELVQYCASDNRRHHRFISKKNAIAPPVETPVREEETAIKKLNDHPINRLSNPVMKDLNSIRNLEKLQRSNEGIDHLTEENNTSVWSSVDNHKLVDKPEKYADELNQFNHKSTP